MRNAVSQNSLKQALVATIILLGLNAGAQAATKSGAGLPPIPPTVYDPHDCEVQPTLRCLPPGVAETETKRTRAQKDFDKKLELCRDC